MALPEHTKGEESFPVRDTWCQMQGVELKHQALGNRLSGGAAVADRLCLECFEAVLDRRGSLIRPTQPTRGTSIFLSLLSSAFLASYQRRSMFANSCRPSNAARV